METGTDRTRNLKRYISGNVGRDLPRKMVFIGGPRQVGKTTLSKSLLGDTGSGRYFNWDNDPDRMDVLKRRWRSEERLLIFDEIHKYPRWKGFLKGLYDVNTDNHQFLVTGSARLDVYRKGGDSLFGRYHYWRLHPFTIDERPEWMDGETAFARLMRVGGFPEPFLLGDETEARRWRKERFDRVLREDVRDLESIRDIRNLELFLDLLRQRVGTPAVLSNIASDLRISPTTAFKWLEVLERMYLLFPVRPYTTMLSRAIQKPPKVYFFDNADVVGDGGAVFENLVATTLLKRLHFLEDSRGLRCDLRYIRDKEKREVDFAVVIDGKLHMLVEAKISDEEPSRHLRYYTDRLKPARSVQLVAGLKRPFDSDGIQVRDPVTFFEAWLKD